MSLSFVIPEMNIGGNGTEVPTLQFWKKGFRLAGDKIEPTWRDIILHGNTALTLVNAKADSLEYLKLFGGTEQRNLPSGFTQVEYLESSGTQYIDTGITDITNSEFEVVAQQTSITGAFPTIMGALDMDSNYKIVCGLSTANNAFYSQCGGAAGYIVSSVPNDTQKHTFKVTTTTNQQTLQVDDTAVVIGNYAITSTTGYSLTICARNKDTISNFTSQKVFSVRIKKSGTLIQNLIPAKRNSDNILGMYDTVTGNFFTNAGTGTFTAGADITAPSPDTPMDIVCNNGVIKVRNKSGLPLGYQAVEYLESTGTQYIDTGYKSSNNTKVKARISCSDFGNFIFGSRNNISGSNQKRFGLYFDLTWNPQYANQNGTGKKTVRDTIYNIEMSRDGFYVNGDLDTSFTLNTFSGDYNMYLFANNTADTSIGYGSCKIYSFEIYTNNVLVHKYIPAKNSSNVLGMYDTVSGNFLTNQGTGDFTAGADIDDMEIYVDGTTETVEITGKNLFDVDNNLLVGYYINNSTGILTQSSDGSSSCFKDFLPSKPNVTYTMSRIAVTSTTAMRMWAYDKDKNLISLVFNSQLGAVQITGTTPAGTAYIRCSFGSIPQFSQNVQLELGSTATTYEPYYNGGTATAENLFKVGNYQDIQSIIDGGVTRNVGIKVLDGTENWVESSNVGKFNAQHLLDGADSRIIQNTICFCTHFLGVVPSISLANMEDLTCKAGWINGSANFDSLYVAYAKYENNLVGFRQYLVDQYNAGTPVIIVYPLATPTTETVTPQPMNIQEGTNIVQITQASMDDLELEVKYKAGVSVTITEIENAQLDDNVEVIING